MSIWRLLEDFNNLRLLLSSYSPYTFRCNRCFQPCKMLAKNSREAGPPIHSRKAAAKLMETFPSQLPFPCLLTRPGMFFVSSSSMWSRMPRFVLKPTIILGTPSRNDWIQNFWSLRSYLSMSLSFSMHAEVLSSTQSIGLSLSVGFCPKTK